VAANPGVPVAGAGCGRVLQVQDSLENRVYKFPVGSYKREGVMNSTAKFILSLALSRFPHPCISIKISIRELIETGSLQQDFAAEGNFCRHLKFTAPS
jgi:hypothetical protein